MLAIMGNSALLAALGRCEAELAREAQLVTQLVLKRGQAEAAGATNLIASIDRQLARAKNHLAHLEKKRKQLLAKLP